MKLFLITFIIIYSFLYARENPFLPDYYDKNRVKNIKIREKKGGEKIITKRIFLNVKNIKKINKIIIEYEDSDGKKTVQSIRMNDFDVINNYIDISQSNKPVKLPQEYDRKRYDEYYKRYKSKKNKRELEDNIDDLSIKPFKNVK